ncbi:hypothetical protein [Flavobacterium mesophilum]|uniref:hypothetical protein n=1 Tax=Flavobacterium mesophilum TaxID=3143495 RepID=UPI0031D93828
MHGTEFYDFLTEIFLVNGQNLYGNFSFNRWLPKNDGTNSFQFQGITQRKAIPKTWLVDAKNAKNNGEIINRKWFNNFYGNNNYDDCRASVAVYLLTNYGND